MKNKTIFIGTILLIFLTNNVLFCQSFLNPSFENWGSPGGCQVNVAPDDWSEYSNGGSGADECDFSYCPTIIPSSASQGNVYARMYSPDSISGEGMYQMISGFVTGNSYLISFDFCGSELFGGTADVSIHFFIDDMDVAQTPVFSSTDPNWQTFSHNFIASLASHKIGVRAYMAGSGTSTGSAAIDNFQFNTNTGLPKISSKNGIAFYPNPFHEKITFYTENPMQTQLTLFDHSMRIIFTTFFNRETTLQLEGLANGIYFYALKSFEEVQNGAIIKQ
jgi:hypothetical protein